MKPIKTKQFILRPFRKSDASDIVRNINDRQIFNNTLSIPYPYSLSDAKKWINKAVKRLTEKDKHEVNFALEINKEAVGSVGLSGITEHKAEIGYWLARKYHGQGIMTRAVKVATQYGFKELKLKRITGHVFKHNKASMKVLQKNGYKMEGIMIADVKKQGKLLDVYLYAKVIR